MSLIRKFQFVLSTMGSGMSTMQPQEPRTRMLGYDSSEVVSGMHGASKSGRPRRNSVSGSSKKLISGRKKPGKSGHYSTWTAKNLVQEAVKNRPQLTPDLFHASQDDFVDTPQSLQSCSESLQEPIYENLKNRSNEVFDGHNDACLRAGSLTDIEAGQAQSYDGEGPKFVMPEFLNPIHGLVELNMTDPEVKEPSGYEEEDIPDSVSHDLAGLQECLSDQSPKGFFYRIKEIKKFKVRLNRKAEFDSLAQMRKSLDPIRCCDDIEAVEEILGFPCWGLRVSPESNRGEKDEAECPVVVTTTIHQRLVFTVRLYPTRQLVEAAKAVERASLLDKRSAVAAFTEVYGSHVYVGHFAEGDVKRQGREVGRGKVSRIRKKSLSD